MKLLPHRELAHVPGNLATMHQQIQTPAPDGAGRKHDCCRLFPARVRLTKNFHAHLQSCGRYFALTVHGSTEYCSRVFDSRGRTCKEVGAMRQYVQSHAQDELLKIYRREYKRRFAWIRVGKNLAESMFRVE